MTDAEDLLHRWLVHMAHNKGRSSDTVDKYRSGLLRLRELLGGAAKLLEATPEDLEAFTGLHLHKGGLFAQEPRSQRSGGSIVGWATRGTSPAIRPTTSPTPTPGSRCQFP